MGQSSVFFVFESVSCISLTEEELRRANILSWKVKFDLSEDKCNKISCSFLNFTLS